MIGTLDEDLFTFTIIFRRMFVRMRYIQTKIVEKIKSHILCSKIFVM